MSDAGELFVADAAEQRGYSNPEAFWSHFKLGFSSRQLHLGPRRLSTMELTCELLRTIRNEAARQLGSREMAVVLSFPPRYVEHNRGLLREACTDAGFSSVSLISEPVATVTYHAWLHDRAAADADGEIVLVYDLGAGGFSAALVLRSGTGRLELLDHVESPQPSGLYIDRLLYQHVAQRLSEKDEHAAALLQPGSADPAGHHAQVDLLRSCRRAKEVLGEGHEYTIGVSSLGAHLGTVRLEPREFENLVRPVVLDTMRDCRELLARAGVSAAAVASVVVSGGGARIRWLADLVSDGLVRNLRPNRAESSAR